MKKPWSMAVTMGFAASFLFGGYEFTRSTANTLFNTTYGPENLPVVMILMPVGLVIMLYGYGRLLSRFGPRRALWMTSVISSLGILACFGAFKAGWKPATGILYILRDVYVVLLCEQYWSFMDSILGTEIAKRYNGLYCGLGSVGSVFGAYGVSRLSQPMGTSAMLLIGALAILPAALLADIAYRRGGEPLPRPEEVRSHDHLGVSLFRVEPRLIFLLLLIITTQIVSTSLDLSFQTMLQKEFPMADAQNAFSGRYFAMINLAAALGQFLLSPLLLRFLPLWVLHLGIPIIHLGACGFLVFSPSLASAGLAFLLFKSIDYSIFRTAKEILYIPLSFDIRFRAKEIIDVFGYRFGKAGTSLFITLAKQGGVVFSHETFGLMAMGGSAFWLFLIIPITKPFKESPSEVSR